MTGETCTRCQLELADPRAVRLGEINREYADLMREREAVLADLEGRAAAPSRPVSLPSASPAVPTKSGPAGQQVLLTIGALLLLGAASVFVLAVWILVGRYGQVALLLTAVVSGVTASFVLSRRRLSASAETAAALAVGFAAIAAGAAHGWNLLGLHAIPFGWYLGGGSAVFGAIGAAAHLASRRGPAPVNAYLWTAMGGFALSALIAVLRVLAVASAEPGRYVAAVALVAYALAASAVLPRWPGRRIEVDAVAPWITAVLLGVASFVALADLPYGALAGLSLAVGALVAGAVLRLPTLERRYHAAAAVVVAYLPVLYLMLVTIGQRGVTGSGSLRATVLDNGPFTPLPLWAPTLAAMAFVLPAAAAVLRHRTRPGYGAASFAALEVSGSFALANALMHSSSRTWAFVAVGNVILQVGVIVVARRLHSGAPAHWSSVELAGAASAALSAFVGLGAAVDVSHQWVVDVLVALTVLAAVVAALPGRRGFSYLVAVLGTAAWWVFLDGDGSVEAYVLPSAMALLLAGAAMWSVQRSTPTLTTLGPGLLMGLMPVTLVGIIEGDAVRLTVATVVGAGLAVLGVVWRLLAPVLLGGIAVLIIVVTQGGPYVAVVPYWITGGLLGAALIAGGIAWEQTAAFGRRSVDWLATLR
ncbi:SCO7613 C-terminal domain-containing membrane protein [Nocardioides baekrokdamisoli]|uniref:SCO7613 C-terminal domain-containing membrane protein n=1 Tax=Nocardioides baekrokdamisoli TaxID=1804624 RepID=UPI0038CD65F8